MVYHMLNLDMGKKGVGRKTAITAHWDNPPRPDQGVTIELVYAGQRYYRRAEPEDFVSQREAAAMLHVTVMAVNKWIRSEQLPSTRRRGISVVRLKDLKRFAQEREKKPLEARVFFVG